MRTLSVLTSDASTARSCVDHMHGRRKDTDTPQIKHLFPPTSCLLSLQHGSRKMLMLHRCEQSSMPDPLLCETSSKGGSLYQPQTTAPLETYQFGFQTEHSVDKLSPQIEKSGESLSILWTNSPHRSKNPGREKPTNPSLCCIFNFWSLELTAVVRSKLRYKYRTYSVTVACAYTSHLYAYDDSCLKSHFNKFRSCSY